MYLQCKLALGPIPSLFCEEVPVSGCSQHISASQTPPNSTYMHKVCNYIEIHAKLLAKY